MASDRNDTSGPARRLGTARAVVRLVRQRVSGDVHAREYAGYRLLEEARRLLAPDYRLTEHKKLWFQDEEFFAQHRRFAASDRSADRKFFLRELLKLVDHLEGDTAEAGVYTGGSSWFICEARRGRGGTHWGFDSFEGLSEPTAADGSYWHGGDLSVSEAAARSLLEPYGARILRGWIPDVLAEAAIERLVFSHLDVDLYEPTLEALAHFYPRTIPGGLIVCDDYGFGSCPGATRAVDEYLRDRPEPVLHCPTGQAIIIKR